VHAIVSAAKAELASASNTFTGNHLKTADIRRLSAKLFRDVEGKQIGAANKIANERRVTHD